jgi:hypothetical protein
VWNSVKIGAAQRIFVIDFDEEKSCNSHIAQRPLIKGVPSAFILPAGHVHRTWTGDEETIVQVSFIGPSDATFVNPDEDPRKSNRHLPLQLDFE